MQTPQQETDRDPRYSGDRHGRALRAATGIIVYILRTLRMHEGFEHDQIYSLSDLRQWH